MYQQPMNAYQGGMQQNQASAYGTGYNASSTMQPAMNQQSFQQKDQDIANLVLSELKRAAGEYTTAAMEVVNPMIRRSFESHLQQTLQMQEQLFQVMKQLQMYGQPTMAAQQDIQQELNHHRQQAGKLQFFVEQHVHLSGRSNQAASPSHMGGSQAGSQDINNSTYSNEGMYGNAQMRYSDMGGHNSHYQSPPQAMTSNPMAGETSAQQRMVQSAASSSGSHTTAAKPVSNHAASAESLDLQEKKNTENEAQPRASHQGRYMM